MLPCPISGSWLLGVRSSGLGHLEGDAGKGEEALGGSFFGDVSCAAWREGIVGGGEKDGEVRFEGAGRYEGSETGHQRGRSRDGDGNIAEGQTAEVGKMRGMKGEDGAWLGSFGQEVFDPRLAN